MNYDNPTEVSKEILRLADEIRQFTLNVQPNDRIKRAIAIATIAAHAFHPGNPIPGLAELQVATFGAMVAGGINPEGVVRATQELVEREEIFAMLNAVKVNVILAHSFHKSKEAAA